MTFGPQGFTLDLDRHRAADHSADARDFPQQPGNPSGWIATLDDLQRSSRLRASAISGSSPTRSMAVSLRRRRPRAVVPRRDGCGRRPHPLREHVLQELGDDRLAHRLDRGAVRRSARSSKTSFNIRHPASPYSCSARRSPRSIRASPSSSTDRASQRGREIAMNRRKQQPRAARAARRRLLRFFSVEGETDSRALVFEADRRGVRGPRAGHRVRARRRRVYLRICFARSPESLSHVVERLTGWLKR